MMIVRQHSNRGGLKRLSASISTLPSPLLLPLEVDETLGEIVWYSQTESPLYWLAQNNQYKLLSSHKGGLGGGRGGSKPLLLQVPITAHWASGPGGRRQGVDDGHCRAYWISLYGFKNILSPFLCYAFVILSAVVSTVSSRITQISSDLLNSNMEWHPMSNMSKWEDLAIS